LRGLGGLMGGIFRGSMCWRKIPYRGRLGGRWGV
jgi:hypothetical protein